MMNTIRLSLPPPALRRCCQRQVFPVFHEGIFLIYALLKAENRLNNCLLFFPRSSIIYLRFCDAPVAQLDRALVYGTKGWAFDPPRARHRIPANGSNEFIPQPAMKIP